MYISIYSYIYISISKFLYLDSYIYRSFCISISIYFCISISIYFCAISISIYLFYIWSKSIWSLHLSIPISGYWCPRSCSTNLIFSLFLVVGKLGWYKIRSLSQSSPYESLPPGGLREILERSFQWYQERVITGFVWSRTQMPNSFLGWVWLWRNAFSPHWKFYAKPLELLQARDRGWPKPNCSAKVGFFAFPVVNEQSVSEIDR